MKGIYRFLLLVGIVFFTVPVVANENILCLVDNKNNLSYDERYMDIDSLTKKIDIGSSKIYKESFVIQNTTLESQELFLHLETKAQDGSIDDLLDYLQLKITVDKKVIYEGSASSLNSSLDGNVLLEYIPLGKYDKNQESNCDVEFSIVDSYRSISDNKYAYVYWSFYTKDKDNDYIEIEKLTSEMFYNFLDVWVFCGFCIGVAFIVLAIYYIRMRIEYKRIHNKDDKKKDKDKEKKEKKEK